jgi:hypothetical protein
MAKPMSISTSDVSVSDVAGLCHYIAPFSVSVITTVTGTATYTLQYTADNIQAASFTPAGANWQSHPQMTDATTSSIVEFTAPVTAVRLNQTVGNGSVAGKVIQAGQ